MRTNHLAAAVIGASLVVITYEAVPLVRGEDGMAGSAQASCAKEPLRPALRHRSCTTPENELGQLEQRLDECGLEGRILRARLGRYEGFEQPWPENLPHDLGAAGFEDTLHAVLYDREDVELLGVDCDEFPCLAVLGSFDANGWPVLDLHQDLGARLGEDVGVWNVASASELGGVSVSLQLVAPVLPETLDEEVARRLEHRAQVLAEDWSEELLHELQ